MGKVDHRSKRYDPAGQGACQSPAGTDSRGGNGEVGSMEMFLMEKIPVLEIKWEFVARLVLERRGPRTAGQCLSVSNRMGVERRAVSLATALPVRPASCVSTTDGSKFKVTLKKNACGLGFSFVQVEESSTHLKNDLVRIKRLFPGQPAENGAIAAGDIILAMNGQPTEELVFQEVLHLLRVASQKVMLFLYRPPPDVLPDMVQGWQRPISDKEFTRAMCTDSEWSRPSLDPEDSQRDHASLDVGEGLGLKPESFQQATKEAQWDQDMERRWAASLMHPRDSHPHCLWNEAR
ncbi:LOW QUALITY PROTEIN: FERM and PDZ domain-containing protein 2 [Rhynchonycteris naso]